MPQPSNEERAGLPQPSNKTRASLPKPSNEMKAGFPQPSNEMRAGFPQLKLVIFVKAVCFVVLNVADGTGLNPSPALRTSLRVTSRVQWTVLSNWHYMQQTENIAQLQGAILLFFCFYSFVLLLLIVLFSFCFGHNQGCIEKTIKNITARNIHGYIYTFWFWFIDSLRI